ncbi:hypothetical protein [Dactylosporangium sp. CA-139066]|uniref:hypothetical protein n=1 Tax=Dactylosporangium sp. CA-139066 TaxID=3239930 RepID=UPI003D8C5295
MNDHDTYEACGPDAPAVLDALRASMDGVTMGTPVERIVAAGRARRQRRRVATGVAAAVVAGGVALGVTTYANPAAAPPAAPDDAVALHIQTVGYTVDRTAGGIVKVTWDKQRYFDDRAGLEAALHQAGFPVVIRVGEFCAGPGDDTTLDRSGTGPGVDAVVGAEREEDGRVIFTFNAAAMPAGKQLFIGYLNDAQLQVTGGAPGSVERLVSTGVQLTCTTTPPPPNGNAKQGAGGGKEPGPERKPAPSGEPKNK